MLKTLQENGETIRAIMNPDANPYSWYENREAHGIAADIFRATAEALQLNYEIVPVATREEYEAHIAAGDVDIWLDLMMGVNAKDSVHFYSLWKKSLAEVADRVSAEIVQTYWNSRRCQPCWSICLTIRFI